MGVGGRGTKSLDMVFVDNEDAYRNLASAIILQAVNDYCNAVAVVKAEKHTERDDIEQAKIEKSSCEHFFKSEWYKQLSVYIDMDGESIIETVNNMVDTAKPYISDGKKYRCPYCNTTIANGIIKWKKYPVIRCKSCMKLIKLR